MKKAELETWDYPRHVTFCDRPLLDALVAELTETLRTRYVPEPSNHMDEFLRLHLERLRSLERRGLDVPADIASFEEQLQTTDLAKWTECQKHLEKDSNWLVDTFRKHLSNRQSWPENDAAQNIPIASSKLKRRRPPETVSENATKKCRSIGP